MNAVSRRWFLAGAGAAGCVALGVAGGAITAVERRHPAPRPTRPAPNPPPPALLAAAARERRLIADLDATTGGTPAVRAVLLAARADHAAHLVAVEQVLKRFDPVRPAGAPSPSTAPPTTTSLSTGTSPSASSSPLPRGVPRTRAQLRDAETRAATAHARAARTLPGPLGALLASASACEATHAALLA